MRFSTTNLREGLRGGRVWAWGESGWVGPRGRDGDIAVPFGEISAGFGWCGGGDSL